MALSLDFFLGWLLNMHPALAVLVISLILSVIITLSLKLFTDQNLMKDLRNEMNELQKELKELKNNPKRMAKINERFMETNSKYMMQSFRPTLFTFLPLILVFGWLSSNMGYSPLFPDQRFTATLYFEKGTEGSVLLNTPKGIILEGNQLQQIINDQVSWAMKAEEGNYNLTFSFMNKTYVKDVLITTEKTYAPVEKDLKKHFLFFSSPGENGLNKIELSNKKTIIFADVPIMKSIPWVNTWSWFGGYIFFSIVFSMLLRKVFKIY